MAGSVVYLAEDPRLKRRVALKLLAAELVGDESFRDRFRYVRREGFFTLP